MKKLTDDIRCLGQSFDTGEVCPEIEECARYINLSGECLDMRISSTHFKDGKCNQKIKTERN